VVAADENLRVYAKPVKEHFQGSDGGFIVQTVDDYVGIDLGVLVAIHQLLWRL